MTPFLKWPGGKRKLAARISAHFGGPPRRAYHEPCLGAGAVLLHRLASGEVHVAYVGDANLRLVRTWAAVAYAPDVVAGMLDSLPRTVDREIYMDLRLEFNAYPPNWCRTAALMIWLNKAGFNGLYRENRAGELNVAPGPQGAPVRLPSRDHLRAIAALVGHAVGAPAERDACTGVWCARDGDQVYVDPPYLGGFSSYHRPFGLDAHRKLARACAEAGSRGAVVLVSGSDVTATHEVYVREHGLQVIDRLGVGRSIGSHAQASTRVGEVLLRAG